MNHLCHLRRNTETVSGSSGSLPMSGRNGSASDADCRISEDCRVPDVELMELGPLLEEGGGRQAGSKGLHPEVRLFQTESWRNVLIMAQSLQYSPVILLKGAAMLADDDEEDDEVGEVLTLPLQAHHAMEKMEEFVHKVKRSSVAFYLAKGLIVLFIMCVLRSQHVIQSSWVFLFGLIFDMKWEE